MKTAHFMTAVSFFLVLASCARPNTVQMAEPPKSAVLTETNLADSGSSMDAYDHAFDEFMKVRRDIPFGLNSAELRIDGFLKSVMIPALTNLINALPSGKKIFIDGYASRTGTEGPSEGFIGNIALSKSRVESVLKYVLSQTGLDGTKFEIRANGSSKPLDGEDPASVKNCRVSFNAE